LASGVAKTDAVWTQARKALAENIIAAFSNFSETMMTRLEEQIHAAVDEQGEAFERYQRGFRKVLPQWAPRGSGVPDTADLGNMDNTYNEWQAAKKRTEELLADWRHGG
jgi:hypothetical protein